MLFYQTYLVNLWVRYCTLLYNSECFPIKLIWYTYGYVIVPCCITQCFSYLINLSGKLMGTLLYLVVFYYGVLCDDDVHWPINLQKQTQGVKQSHPFRGSLLSTLIYTKALNIQIQNTHFITQFQEIQAANFYNFKSKMCSLAWR